MKEGGIPEVYAMPTITVAGKSEHIMGKKTLADGWTGVTNATDDEKKNYHFFKIEMKSGWRINHFIYHIHRC